jgi:uncharacterized protein (TIGR00106 family)
MKVAVEICVVPIGTGTSVSQYVAECQRVLERAGLAPQMHAYGTNVEGEWEQVFAALKACHEALHAMGAPRLFTSLKVGTRIDKEQTLTDKVQSVERLLAEGGNAGARTRD